MSVDLFRSPEERAVFAAATLPELRVRAHPAAVQGVGERLAHEAEAYLAAVDFFRAEGLELTWRSDDAAISPCLHALDGAGRLSLTGEGIEG